VSPATCASPVKDDREGCDRPVDETAVVCWRDLQLLVLQTDLFKPGRSDIASLLERVEMKRHKMFRF
jgi:hypothetical protein